MALVPVVAFALLGSLLVSGLAARSPLSIPVVFLVTGLIAGPVGLDIIDLQPEPVARVCSAVLFFVLLVDGQHAPARVWRRHGRDAAVVLLVGMLGAAAIVTLATRLFTPLPWLVCLIFGAIMSPTDPVFASAIVANHDVPARLRALLNIESGLNDGLALPAVLLAVGATGASVAGESTHLPHLLLEIALGVLLGAAVPVVVAGLTMLPGLGPEARLLPLGPIAGGLVLWVLCEWSGANPFVAAFIGGAVYATLAPEASAAFDQFGELLSELGKNVGLLIFLGLVSRPMLADMGVGGVVVALVAIFIARPLPVALALVGSKLTGPERAAAAWFGPKGFSSVAYVLLLVESDVAQSDHLLALTATAVLVSVVAHASTDVPVVAALARRGLTDDVIAAPAGGKDH